MLGLTTLAFLALIPGISSNSQTSDCSYLGLLNHLQQNMTNESLLIMRPVKDWRTPTLVKLDMVLFGILEVDEKSQTVTSHIWIQMSWKNEFLPWNSSVFCGINMLSLPRSMLWTPDICIEEDVSDAGSVKESPLLSLTNSGWITTRRRQLLTSTCHLNLNMFPFDVQFCNISFSSMSYKEDNLKLETLYGEETLALLSELLMITHGEWQLKNLTITLSSPEKGKGHRSILVYMIVLTRKPLLYVINLIIPLLYFLILDLASFFIKGEKLSFKVTILLSISVLLLILQDMLPSTESTLPLVANYCITVFTLVGLSILEVILVDILLGLDDGCGKEVQSSVNTQVGIQLEANCHKDLAVTQEKGQMSLERKPGVHDLLQLILEEVKSARQQTRRQCEERRKPGRYKRLAQIIDSVFFCFYFFTILIYLVCMYTMWVNGSIDNY